jgi:hypothetical protein
MIVFENVEEIPCLLILLCVNKRFEFFCRQRLVSLKREIEAMIRHDIQCLLKVDLPWLGNAAQVKVNEIMWTFVSASLERERVFYEIFATWKNLREFSEDTTRSMAQLKLLSIRVQHQQPVLQALVDENKTLADALTHNRKGNASNLTPADIFLKNIDGLHEKIMAIGTSLRGEVELVKSADQTPQWNETWKSRFRALIEEYTSKMQALLDKFAARRTTTRRARAAHRTVEILQQEKSLMAELHGLLMNQALALQEESNCLLFSVKERLVQGRASGRRCKSLLLSLKRIARRGFSKLEKRTREGWSNFASIVGDGWVAVRQAAYHRINAAMADRLRIGAETRTAVDRARWAQAGGDGEVPVSFAEGFEDFEEGLLGT